MSEETSHREFEEWANQHEMVMGLDPTFPIEYENFTTQTAWEAWQAAREALAAVEGGQP